MKAINFDSMEQIEGGWLCNGFVSGALAGAGLGLTLSGVGAGLGLALGVASVGVDLYCSRR